MTTETPTTESWESAYQEASSLWSPYYQEAYSDLRYYVGDQWSEEEKSYLNREKRSALVFNKIRRIVKMISGYQRKNRLSSLCEPIEGGDQISCELLSDALIWVIQYGNGYNRLQECYHWGCSNSSCS